MNELAISLDTICTFNEIFWLYQWVNTFLEKKHFIIKRANSGKILDYTLYAMYVIIVFCLNRLTLTSAYTMIIILIWNYFAVLFFWKSDITQTFAVVGGYFFAMFLEGNIAITFLGMLGGEELIRKCTGEHGGTRVIFLLINGSLWYILNKYSIARIRKRNVRTQNRRDIACISAIGFVGSAFIGTILVNSFSIRISTIWYAFLIVVLIMIFVIYYIMKQRELQLQMTILSAKNEMLEKNYVQVNDFYTANAKLYHDMNHHFDVVYHMLQQGEQEQAQKYISTLRSTNPQSLLKVQSGINVLDAILYEFDLKSQKKGVKYVVETPLLPNNLGMESRDICSLFANLLENALEAASKEIYLQIKKVNQALFITVKNDYSGVLKKRGNRFLTQKRDKNLHGWGTQIVEQIVNKYEGSIKYDNQNGYFVVYIMLNEKMNMVD